MSERVNDLEILLDDLRDGEYRRLAAHMCMSSHHGLTRTKWPCRYHAERALNTMRSVRGELPVPAARPEEPGE